MYVRMIRTSAGKKAGTVMWLHLVTVIGARPGYAYAIASLTITLNVGADAELIDWNEGSDHFIIGERAEDFWTNHLALLLAEKNNLLTYYRYFHSMVRITIATILLTESNTGIILNKLINKKYLYFNSPAPKGCSRNYYFF